MKKYLLFVIFGLFIFAGCKQDTKIKDKVSKTVKPTENKEVNQNDAGTDLAPLFNPCSLISNKELADILNITADRIKIKPTGSSGNFSKSCYLYWENVENGAKNSMFLMLQTDPIPGEFEDWAKSFLEAKINTGDMGYPDTSMPYKYERIKDMDVLAAYNDELKRIFWKFNPDYVLAIFYNAGLTEKNRKEYAKEIAKIMNKNLAKKLK